MTSSIGGPRSRIFTLLRSGVYADLHVDPFEIAKRRPFFAPNEFDSPTDQELIPEKYTSKLNALPQVRIEPDGLLRVVTAPVEAESRAETAVKTPAPERAVPDQGPVLRWPTTAIEAHSLHSDEGDGTTLRWPKSARAAFRAATAPKPPTVEPTRLFAQAKGTVRPKPIQPAPRCTLSAKEPDACPIPAPEQTEEPPRQPPSLAQLYRPIRPVVPDPQPILIDIPEPVEPAEPVPGPRDLDVPMPWVSPYPPKRPFNTKPIRVAGVLTARLAVGTVSTSLVTAAMVFLSLVYLFARDLPGPEALLTYSPPLITQVHAADGRLLDEFATERRIYVTADEVPDLVKAAVISAEDKNFYIHDGYDLRAMAHAAADAFQTKGETMRGASTITQQVMKNFLLSDMPLIERKVKEIVLANRIERVLGKERILELYLNEIFLGQNSYGIAAAARTYFNKPLDDLTLGEAAVLAALPKAPSNLHPVRDQSRLRARRNYVLEEMYENGFITKADFEHEISEPVRSVQNGDMVAYGADRPPRTYFTDEIRRQLSERLGPKTFVSGGLTVEASVDLALQEKAALALQGGLEQYDRRQALWRPTGLTIAPETLKNEADWRAALRSLPIARDIELGGKWHPAVVLEAGTRSARIGIEDVAEDADGHWIGPSNLGWTRRLNADGKRSGRVRGAGDLLKTGEVIHVRAITNEAGGFLYWSLRQVPEIQGGFLAMEIPSGRIIAMQGGFSYQHSSFNRATQAKRQPGSAFKPIVYAAALDRGYHPASKVSDDPIAIKVPGGVWRPKNYSHDSLGETTLRIGLERSRNVMTVRLAEEIGIETIADYAERLGAYDHLGKFMAVSLGAQGTSLLRMVSAYGAIANGGRRVIPQVVGAVADRDGAPMDARAKVEIAFDASDDQVLDPITAYQLTSMLRGVVERGTARSAVNLPVPAAGKTGTTNGAKDVWFVGFTSTVVAGCYMGFDTPRPLGAGSFGGSMCAPVFNEFMTHAVEKYGGEEFAVPEGGEFVKFDRRTGTILTETAEGGHVIEEFIRTAPLQVEDTEGSVTALILPVSASQNAVGLVDQN